MSDIQPVKGLRIDVYRHAAREMDCTLGGITAKNNVLTLVGVIDATGPGTPGFAFVPDWRVSPVHPDMPPVAVVLKTGWNSDDLYVYLEPLDIAPDGTVTRPPGRPMEGGNFAGTGDSRFAQVLKAITGHTNPGVLSVHDRYE